MRITYLHECLFRSQKKLFLESLDIIIRHEHIKKDSFSKHIKPKTHIINVKSQHKWGTGFIGLSLLLVLGLPYTMIYIGFALIIGFGLIIFADREEKIEQIR